MVRGGESIAVYILWKYYALFNKGQKFIFSKVCERYTSINTFVTVKGVGGAFNFICSQQLSGSYNDNGPFLGILCREGVCDFS